MGLLAVGAGASKGLDTLLERLMSEEKVRQSSQQIAESGRSNRASEALRGREIDETSAIRRANADETAKSHREQDAQKQQVNEDRDANRILGRIKLRPIGADVPMDEFKQEIGAGASRGSYDYHPPLESQNAETGVTTNQQEGFKFKGTQDEIQRADNEELSRRRANESNADRDASRKIADDREKRLTSWGPPVVTIGDPNIPGGARIVSRGNVPAEGVRAPQPAAEREKVDAYKNTVKAIDDIVALGDKTGWQGIGPIAGTVGSLKMKYLGKGDPNSERLRNALSQLTALASFQEGGKQFTGTEKKLLDDFLASYRQNPKAAVVRLKQFKDSATRFLNTQGVSGGPSSPSAATSAGDDPEGLFK